MLNKSYYEFIAYVNLVYKENIGHKKNEETKEQTVDCVIRAKKLLIEEHAKNEKKKAMYLINDNIKKSNV